MPTQKSATFLPAGVTIAPAATMRTTPISICLVLLTALAASAATIAIKVSVYPAMLSLSGSRSLLAQAGALLAIYAAAVAWPSSNPIARPLFATRIGALGGIV